MTTIPSHMLAAAVALAALGGPVSPSFAAEPTPPKLAEALRAKSKNVLVLQPVQLARSQTLLVTHTQFADGSVRPGEQRAVQLVVYSSTPDQGGDFPVLFSNTQVIAGAGAGGGPHVKVFDGYTNDAETRGIIAILIGLLLPAVQTDPVKIVPLPATDALTAEIRDPSGIGLLLPAVQKVREAAAR